jgi:multiple sugar transport system ATP-binding protein
MTIELRNVVKSYGQRIIVPNLDLTVENGAFTVLLGPSGCGKTTTLRMIAGLEQVRSGDIYLDGRRVTDLSPKQRGVAMVFQDYGLYPHMSVLENVAFPLKISHVPGDERRSRAHEMLARLHIDHLAQQRPGRISGGEKQRVSLARALVRKPNVLLMDEPLSNLDALLRARMRAEIKSIHQEMGTTTLYVTHDQVEALSLGTAIAVMRSGRVEQYAAPHEIYHDPATLFVARFVGAPSMNFLRARAERGDGKVMLRAPSFALAVPVSAATALPDGGEVIVGVRPEHLAVMPPGTFGAVPARIKLVEPLGHDQYLHVAAGSESLILRTDPEAQFRVGQELALAPIPHHLRFFDPQSEQRIR